MPRLRSEESFSLSSQSSEPSPEAPAFKSYRLKPRDQRAVAGPHLTLTLACCSSRCEFQVPISCFRMRIGKAVTHIERDLPAWLVYAFSTKGRVQGGPAIELTRLRATQRAVRAGLQTLVERPYQEVGAPFLARAVAHWLAESMALVRFDETHAEFHSRSLRNRSAKLLLSAFAPNFEIWSRDEKQRSVSLHDHTRIYDEVVQMCRNDSDLSLKLHYANDELTHWEHRIDRTSFASDSASMRGGCVLM